MGDIRTEVTTSNLLGEGPVWVAREQALYWVDIPGKTLHRFDPAAGAHSTVTFDEPIACVAPRAGGGFVGALASGFVRLDAQGEFAGWLARPEAALPGNRFNDGGVDPRGRFYCGTMDDSGKKPRQALGALYRLEADGTASAVVRNVAVSNSTCWSPDGGTMYFCDTGEDFIRAYDYDLETGAPGAMRVFAAKGSAPGRPDGSAVDAEGYVWNARVTGSCLARYAPDGSLDRIVELPVSFVTCPAFGGPDMKTLYFTSGAEPLDAAQRAAQPLAGALLSITVDVPGLVKPEASYPDLPSA
ncbi:MAG: SMP-30/gluconolactonase/LRE family protein [Alphaproteobacteria bacterium]